VIFVRRIVAGDTSERGKDMEEFRICPVCGYGRGFHVFLKPGADGPAVGFICPSCGSSFDPGWTIRLDRPAGPESGPAYPSRTD
jgi:hypothetical protein